MKLNCIKTLPPKLFVAFSGGVDSVVMTHVAMKLRRDVTLAFYNHRTPISISEQNFAISFAERHNLKLIIGECNREQTGSKEKFWRDCRYEFFKSLGGPVCTGGNLSDAVEWYMMTCLRGRGEFMEYSHDNVIRPLLLSSKADIIEYAEFHNLQHYTDESNDDVLFTPRNKIRHEILPKCLEINPGLYSVVKKRIFEKTFNK